MTLALAVTLASGLSATPAVAAGPPQVGFAWTSGVSESGARLNAEVSPNGLATTYHFQYLSEAAYQANLGAGGDGFAGAARVPASGSDPTVPGTGTAAIAVSQPVGGLAPGAAYRFRVQASNGFGGAATTDGPARPFSTLPLRSNAFMLDGRGWEVVSPVDKGGGEVQGPGESFGGGTIQAAAGGSALTYSSTYSFGAGAPGAVAGSQYLATRGGAGWATANITQPAAVGAYGLEPDGVPFQLFASDLSRALMLDGMSCVGAGDPCLRGYSLRGGGGGLLASTPRQPDLRFAGASADLGQVVVSTCAALTDDATEVAGPDGCDPAQPNLYLWSQAGLGRLVNVLPGESEGTPGATLAARSGAVSADGSRVYFELGGDLYLRDGTTTKRLDAAAGGGGTFEAASADGSVAFFSAAGHLWRYLAAGPGSSVDLTPTGGLQGVLGASASGDRVYYQDGEALKLWRAGAGAGTTTTVAAGADAAAPANFPPATGTARLTADGSHLAFLSRAPLTGYDNRGADNAPPGQVGVPQTEVFLYAGAGSLSCVSCNRTGERPLGPSSIPAATANGGSPWATRSYRPRALSADGRRLFFDSGDDLALHDRTSSPSRSDPDVYEWEAAGAGSCRQPGGCIALISSGRTAQGASFLDASASGSDVFFLTEESLVGSDAALSDVYDAREGGGFPEPSRPIECVGDACQFLPSEPYDPSPSTLVPSGGNPPLRIVSGASPRRPGRCRKGFVRRRVKVKKGKGKAKTRCVRKGRSGKRKKSAKRGRGAHRRVARRGGR